MGARNLWRVAPSAESDGCGELLSQSIHLLPGSLSARVVSLNRSALLQVSSEFVQATLEFVLGLRVQDWTNIGQKSIRRGTNRRALIERRRRLLERRRLSV